MRRLEQYFVNKAIDEEKLLKFGFMIKDGAYCYEKKICDGAFKVIIYLSENLQYSKVIDVLDNEEYVLADISDAGGDFVGRIKDEYEKILMDMVDSCTDPDVFKTKQAKEVIHYVKEKYGDELEFLWKKFPDNAIWRNKNNQKWYGILMKVSKRKLGMESDEISEIIDVRVHQESIAGLIDDQKIFAGYHMNKIHWITILLDGSIEIEKILAFVDDSYRLSCK